MKLFNPQNITLEMAFLVILALIALAVFCIVYNVALSILTTVVTAIVTIVGYSLLHKSNPIPESENAKR